MGTAGKVRETFVGLLCAPSLELVMGVVSESFESRRETKYLGLFLEEGKTVKQAHFGEMWVNCIRISRAAGFN